MPVDPAKRRDYFFALMQRCLIGENGEVETVEKVASDLDIGRTYAHSLLREARRMYAMRTAIVIHHPPEVELVRLVREHLAQFGIRDVRIVASHADDSSLDTPAYRSLLRRSLGAASADFVALELKPRPGDHIALAGGRTSTAFAEFFQPQVSDLVFRPLATGGRWRTAVHADASAVLQIIAHRLVFSAGEAGPGSLRVVCPEVPPAVAIEVNRLVRRRADEAAHVRKSRGKGHDGSQPEHRHREVLAVFGPDAPPVDIVVTSIGRRRYVPSGQKYGPHPGTSSYVRQVAEAMYFEEHESRLKPSDIYERIEDRYYEEANRLLHAKDVVGDIARQAIAGDGTHVPGFLERSSVYIPLETLRNWQARASARCVLVVGGSKLTYSFRAALATRCFDSVVVDTALAVQLLPKGLRPRIYRDVPTFKLPGLSEKADPRQAYESGSSDR